MSEKELKAKVEEYFEKYMCVSFEKFIENWEEERETLNYKDKEIERLNNIIKKIVLSCYNSDMTLGEFKEIWHIAFNEEYIIGNIEKLK